MGKRADIKQERNMKHFKWHVALEIFVILISLISLMATRRILLDSAQRIGRDITFGYSIEEERNLEIYETMLMLGSWYIADLDENGRSREEIIKRLKNYFEIIAGTSERIAIEPYAVIDGKLISRFSWVEELDYDPCQTEWYQDVMAANGQTIYTDAYTDAIYDKPVITMAQKCGDSSNAVVIDIYLENFMALQNTQELPDGSAYFMCDSKGTLLYQDIHEKKEQVAFSFEEIYEKLQQNHFQEMNNYYDENGKRMVIYHRKTSNGWHSILVFPHSFLIVNWERIVALYGLVFVSVLAFSAIMWRREEQKKRDIKRTNETLQMLGNCYYALYRVNICRETYEMVKGSDYIREHLNKEGKYENLLEAFQGVISENDYSEFKESFSIANMKRQIEQHIMDFGGDFRRLFGDEWKWVNIRMFFDPSMSKDEVILCFRQVEEEKQQQLRQIQLLEDALKAADTSEKSQKKFFSNISHDMRTPLNVIIGMSELAERCIGQPDQVIAYLQKINFSSRQLLGLINDILEMSRLEQGFALDNSSFNLRENMETCIQVFQTQAERENKKFSFHCEILHEDIYGDWLRLDQILNNLLSNALKYTNPGDSIFVDVKEIENQEPVKYQIRVEDTGIGMSEKFLENIFNMYEREKRYGSQRIEGTGLGMAIVKNILTWMGGEITVESVLDQGSIFTVTLPLQPVQTEKKTKKPEIPYDLNQKRILLVEDYELNMELATDILKLQGAQVVQAWNGKEAVETFEKSQLFEFDAILMDMQMPVMDGCEAAERIRALKREDAKTVPIIALTANAFAEDVARTSKAGMNAHISKPINVSILCETLKKFTAEREYERSISDDDKGML